MAKKTSSKKTTKTAKAKAVSKKTTTRSNKAPSGAKTEVRVHKIKAEVAPKVVKTVAKKPAEVKVETKVAKRKAPKKAVAKLLIPLVALIRYFKQSVLELRRVRWSNRKSTWAMTLAVIGYSGLFLLIVLALDNVFSLLFKLMLGQ